MYWSLGFDRPNTFLLDIPLNNKTMPSDCKGKDKSTCDKDKSCKKYVTPKGAKSYCTANSRHMSLASLHRVYKKVKADSTLSTPGGLSQEDLKEVKYVMPHLKRVRVDGKKLAVAKNDPQYMNVRGATVTGSKIVSRAKSDKAIEMHKPGGKLAIWRDAMAEAKAHFNIKGLKDKHGKMITNKEHEVYKMAKELRDSKRRTASGTPEKQPKKKTRSSPRTRSSPT